MKQNNKKNAFDESEFRIYNFRNDSRTVNHGEYFVIKNNFPSIFRYEDEGCLSSIVVIIIQIDENNSSIPNLNKVLYIHNSISNDIIMILFCC